jgi:CTP synthase
MMVPEFESKGMQFVGKDETNQRMEIVELKGHPFFLAVQYHPEFKSRPAKPSPPFLGLILASTNQLDAYLRMDKTLN